MCIYIYIYLIMGHLQQGCGPRPRRIRKARQGFSALNQLGSQLFPVGIAQALKIASNRQTQWVKSTQKPYLNACIGLKARNWDFRFVMTIYWGPQPPKKCLEIFRQSQSTQSSRMSWMSWMSRMNCESYCENGKNNFNCQWNANEMPMKCQWTLWDSRSSAGPKSQRTTLPLRYLMRPQAWLVSPKPTERFADFAWIMGLRKDLSLCFLSTPWIQKSIQNRY